MNVQTLRVRYSVIARGLLVQRSAALEATAVEPASRQDTGLVESG